jgi:hypothetical protein
MILHNAVMGKNPFSLILFSSLVCCRTSKNGRDMCQSLNSGLGVVHKYISEEVQSLMSSTSFSSTESLGGNNFLNMVLLCAWLGLAPHSRTS